jgi:hypothetical protein
LLGEARHLLGGVRHTTGAMHVHPEQFRALARSSPWCWSTLRFVMTHRGRKPGPERVWIRRPDRLRVEELATGEVGVSVAEPQTAAVFLLASEWSRRRARKATRTLPYPTDVTPTYGPDGLVHERPPRMDVDYDSPNYHLYYGVAVLDPAELADGRSDADGHAPVVLDELREADHHGRVAWEAVVRPTRYYDPRCPCCPLLHTEGVDELFPNAAEPGFEFAEAFRVRLDVGTGVCVEVEEIGGSHAGWGHDVHIEAVDEPMPDELFRRPRRRWLSWLRD